MPKPVESENIVSEIEQIITMARQYILIASPVIHFTESVFIKLAGASALGVNINILAGSAPDPAAASLLSVMKNINLTCSENMNARCYLNEGRILITSMGLSDMDSAPAVNTAVLFTAEDDKIIYDTVRSVMEKASSQGVKIIIGPGSDEHKISTDKTYRGFCIGCRMPVTFNPDKPYCSMCRKLFESGGSTSGNFCHSCGAEYDITLGNNLCAECEKVVMLPGSIAENC